MKQSVSFQAGGKTVSLSVSTKVGAIILVGLGLTAITAGVYMLSKQNKE